jgi:ferric-dicitrate binding protein FerR (iron transport regulator)
MSRLTIDITSQQHQSLKALAALQGKTIKQYALERLFPADASGDQAWRELQHCWANASSKAWPDRPRPSASVPSLMRNWARAKPLEPRLCSDCGG